MLKLIKQAAKIVHLNVREELHGEDQVLAMDVRLSCDLPNTFLDTLAPGLRLALYDKAAQGDLDAEHLSVARFPLLAPIDWEGQMAGARLVIHVGKKSDDMEFDAKINKLRLAPKDGGTVTVWFRAQLLPDPPQVGLLSEYLGHKVKVSVTPGAVESAAKDGGHE